MKKKLILASRSPRRAQLLKLFELPFEVHAFETDEFFDPDLSLDEALIQVALKKAEAAAKQYPNDLILAADTIVCHEGTVLGKPKDKQEAANVLHSLSNGFHEVKTALILLLPSDGDSPSEQMAQVDTTKVHFRALSDQEIEAYVSEGSCLDKAGSYGIQDTDFVDGLIGSYSNVVGLPMELLARWLEEKNISEMIEE